MRKTCSPDNLINRETLQLTFDQAVVCPMCHANIAGHYINSAIWEGDTHEFAAIMNFCTGCNNIFLNVYKCSPKSQNPYETSYVTTQLISSTPFLFKKREFDEKLTALSPSFDVIYNQAGQAEADNLDQIAGIGYRKSIEFLVKDFAIYARPDEADKIKNMPLGNCIKEYIDDPRIQVLAEKSVWIGNDETHYVRRHENKDISDMKKFIDALVYFISMVLITEEAEALQKP